jgi:hypothetical protein
LLIIVTVVCIVILTVVTTAILHSVGPANSVGDVRYIDLIAIVLSALAVMLTALGIFLAALAVIGWATFESKLKASSLEYFTSQLGRDGPLRRELETLLVEMSLSGVEKDKPPPQPPADDEPYRD